MLSGSYTEALFVQNIKIFKKVLSSLKNYSAYFLRKAKFMAKSYYLYIILKLLDKKSFVDNLSLNIFLIYKFFKYWSSFLKISFWKFDHIWKLDHNFFFKFEKKNIFKYPFLLNVVNFLNTSRFYCSTIFYYAWQNVFKNNIYFYKYYVIL